VPIFAYEIRRVKPTTLSFLRSALLCFLLATTSSCAMRSHSAESEFSSAEPMLLDSAIGHHPDDCTTALRQFALEYQPGWDATAANPEGEFPRLPTPPVSIEECLNSALGQDRENAVRCSGLIVLKLHRYYMGHFRQSYEIRASKVFAGAEDSPFARVLMDEMGIEGGEFVGSRCAVEWAESIHGGSLFEEIAAELIALRGSEAQIAVMNGRRS